MLLVWRTKLTTGIEHARAAIDWAWAAACILSALAQVLSGWLLATNIDKLPITVCVQGGIKARRTELFRFHDNLTPALQ